MTGVGRRVLPYSASSIYSNSKVFYDNTDLPYHGGQKIQQQFITPFENHHHTRGLYFIASPTPLHMDDIAQSKRLHHHSPCVCDVGWYYPGAQMNATCEGVDV